MDKRQIIAAGVMCFTVGTVECLAHGLEGRPCAQRPIMPVRLHNNARVPLEVLSHAQAYTSRVYRQIGVAIQWLDDGDTVRENLVSPYTVVLMTPQAARRKAQEDGIADDVVGQATAVARRAYVYYDRVVAMSAPPERDLVSFLGYAMAHELGHLILPGRRHSSAGIMRASFPLTARSTDTFVAVEVASICERLENERRSVSTR